MRRTRALYSALVAAGAGWSGFALASGGSDATFERCKRETDKPAIINACSAVIASAKDPRVLERAYNRRGLANERSGQFNAAVHDFSALIALNPKIAGYYDNRMRAYKGSGQLDLALQDSQTAVRMAPGYPFAYHGRGSVFFDQGRYALAIQDFSTALAINASDAPLLVDRGRAWMKMGDGDKAIADFTSAHDIDPNFMPALRERGLAHLLLGHTAQGRSDLTAALASGGADDVASAALSQLDASMAAPSPPAAVVKVAATDLSANQAGPTPTQQAEMDAERKLQALKDAEQARINAAARLKAERLTKATVAAKQALGNASGFVKENRDDPQLLDHLQHITELNTVLPGTEPAPIERSTALLTATLAADPLYVAYAAQHAVEHQRERERTLSDAVQTLKGQKTFLIGAVVQDPTSANAANFLSLAKQVDATLAVADADRAQTLVGTIDAAIDKAGLHESYAASQLANGGATGAGSKTEAPK